MALRDRIRRPARNVVEAIYSRTGGDPEVVQWRRDRFKGTRGDLARAAQITSDIIYSDTRTSSKLSRWRRERFYASAGELTSAIEIVDRAGRPYLISTRDPHIGREIFLTGGFDVARIDSAHTLLRNRRLEIDCVLDIGANIGTSTIEWLARLPEASGHAFEPAPRNARLLRYNIVANGLSKRVRVHEMALSDKDGQVVLELSSTNPGDHRIRTGESLDRASVEVRAARLDSLIDAEELMLSPASTLVCMDVQGHEASVVAGASKFLNAALSPLMCEFWPDALRRAGGYDSMLQHLKKYPVLFEVSPRVAQTSVSELADATRSQTRCALELLALPT